MSLVSGLKSIAIGAAAGVAAITALPFFGVVGTITTAGMVVGSAIGGIAGVVDEFNKR